MHAKRENEMEKDYKESRDRQQLTSFTLKEIFSNH
jgi:hypothetical protein